MTEAAYFWSKDAEMILAPYVQHLVGAEKPPEISSPLSAAPGTMPSTMTSWLTSSWPAKPVLRQNLRPNFGRHPSLFKMVCW
jgi:hypothetical protein